MAANREECPPGCRGKRRYTRREAKAVAKKLEERDGDRMAHYPCTFAGYHVGHVDPQEAMIRREERAALRKAERQAMIDEGLPVPSNREMARDRYYAEQRRKNRRRRRRYVKN